MESYYFNTTEGEKSEIKFSQEQLEYFEKLLRSLEHYGFAADEYLSWDSFLEHFRTRAIEFQPEKIEDRQRWLEMKKSGLSFEAFLQKKIIERTGAVQEDSHSSDIFLDVNIYVSLGSEKAPAFLGDLLNRPTVYGADDLSTAHRIIQHLEKHGGEDSFNALTRFVETVSLKPDLGKYFDYYLANAFNNILGDAAKQRLEELAAKSANFASWFEKMKIDILTKKYLVEKEKIKVDKFDPILEEQHIVELQALHEELKKNPPPTKNKKSMWSPDDMFSGKDTWGDDEDDVDDDNEEEQQPDAVHQPLSLPSLIESIDPNPDLSHIAQGWEKGTLINFYGRFRPKIENGVCIENKNYLSSLFATIGHGRRPTTVPKPDLYLNFLAGIVEQGLDQELLPEKVSVEDAYRATSCAFTRALSVGVLEQRVGEAIEELSLLRDFLEAQAEKMTDSRHTAFMVSLVRQLSVAQERLSQNSEEYANVNLPKSADSFIMYNSSSHKAREMTDFRTLLAEKIRWYCAHDLAHNVPNIEIRQGPDALVPMRGPSFRRLGGLIVNSYFSAINDYKDVEFRDVPVYWEADERLSELKEKKRVVFGRDGRYFFTALKAHELGDPDPDKKLKYVIITSAMSEREKVAKYLQQSGVTLDYAFIDTGFRGSVPEFAMESLASAQNFTIPQSMLDRRIKLLASNEDARDELSRGQRSRRKQDNSIYAIEDRPKSIERPHEFTITSSGRITPSVTPHSVSEQLRAWAVEHTVIRNFAPRLDVNHPPLELDMSATLRKKLEKEGGMLSSPDVALEEKAASTKELQYQKRKDQFAAYLDAHCSDIDPDRRNELLNNALRLYEVSRGTIAPVIKDYASWLLNDLKPDQRLLFLARDALMPWVASRLLVRQGKFPEITKDQLQYAYLSRKLMWQESPEKIKKYLKQLGVEDDDKDLLMADVGVYGAVHHALQELYPQKNLKSRFFISAANGDEFEGYLYDQQRDGRDIGSAWSSISGNPAVHFLEDTFSGFYGSAKNLKEKGDGSVIPQLTTPYSRETYLKRLAALEGIVDCVLTENSDNDPATNKQNLETYLQTQFHEDAPYIMVPHEG